MKKTVLTFLSCLLLCLSQVILAQGEPSDPPVGATVGASEPPAPPTNVTARDKPNDNGHAIRVRWDSSADDGKGKNNVIGYEIYRAASSEAPDSLWVRRGLAPSGSMSYDDNGARDKTAKDYLPKGRDFYYRVKALTVGASSFSAVAGPAQARDDWYNTGRTIVLTFVALFFLLVWIFIAAAKRGRELYVRPLAGIDAIDEAIGRATEMGKPILYVLGLGTAADIATIASFTVLNRVAKKVAEYQTSILVPCYDPIVMTVAQETVKTAYADAGRPDTFQENSVYFVTQSQFAYVAAVNGTMLRERPATNIYLGKFMAESLLLAETGAQAGSIQISGTDEVAQLPFFVVACDYTLLGEELYAASAYLGREPLLLGTLKAQDWAKGLAMLAVLVGIVLRYAVSIDFVRMIFSVTS